MPDIETLKKKGIDSKLLREPYTDKGRYKATMFSIEPGHPLYSRLVEDPKVFDTVNIWEGTESSVDPGTRILTVLAHNVAHVDRPTHIQPDTSNQLSAEEVDVYDKNLEALKQPHTVIIIDIPDSMDSAVINQLILDNLKSERSREAVLYLNVITERIPEGLPYLSDEVINELRNKRILAIMTNSLSIDLSAANISEVRSNHYRLMKAGIVIAERIDRIQSQQVIFEIFPYEEDDDAAFVEIKNIES